MMKGDHSTIGDLAEAFHQVNGGEVKHHRSVSLAMAEEEEVVVLEGQMAIGMDEAGDDGDLSQNSTPDHHGHYRYHACASFFFGEPKRRWNCGVSLLPWHVELFVEATHDAKAYGPWAQAKSRNSDRRSRHQLFYLDAAFKRSP